uniref:Uncharacterized protein n=2 Tax=Arion vulgaris TaxID=1028688 RepID=A0A0B7BQW4_9EUPU
MGAIAYSQLLKCKQNINELSNLVNYGNLENKTYMFLFSKAFPSFTLKSGDNYATGETPGYEQVEKLMEQHNIRKALHVNDIKYEVFNSQTQRQFISDLFVSTKSKLAVLLDNYKVLIFTGDFDGLITSPMVEAALMTTNWSLQEQYNISPRSHWSEVYKTKGFYTKTGQFCRVVVHGAGHQVPHDQPESTLEMMINFVQHGCILNKPF